MTDTAALLLSQMPGVYGKTAALGGVDEMDPGNETGGDARVLLL
jgi:hypothetical protein